MKEELFLLTCLKRNEVKIKAVHNKGSQVGGFITPAGPDSLPRARYFCFLELSALDAKQNHRVSFPDLIKV